MAVIVESSALVGFLLRPGKGGDGYFVPFVQMANDVERTDLAAAGGWVREPVAHKKYFHGVSPIANSSLISEGSRPSR